MSPKPLSTALKAAALSLGLLLQVPAQAGLISGSWDPAFGPALPNLSWSAYAELSASDACTDANGTQTVGSGPCADAKVNAVFLQLYNTSSSAALDWSRQSSFSSNPPNSAVFAICDSSVRDIQAYKPRCGSDFYEDIFDLSKLRIEGGSVLGLLASMDAIFLAQSPGSGKESWPSSALGNAFTLNFTLNGPELWCSTCPDGPVKSQSDGLRQFLVTYTDAGPAKFTDGAGNPLGVVLDEDGNVLGRATAIDGQLVPEPAGLALVLTALGAAALVRRRR